VRRAGGVRARRVGVRRRRADQVIGDWTPAPTVFVCARRAGVVVGRVHGRFARCDERDLDVAAGRMETGKAVGAMEVTVGAETMSGSSAQGRRRRLDPHSLEQSGAVLASVRHVVARPYR
jgi:hypothetical protein